MQSINNRIQERLSLLEAGEALETCLEGLPEDEALLIKKAAFLRSMPKPERAAERVINQRQELLQIAKERKDMAHPSPTNKHQPNWIWPLALAGGGIVILMFAFIFAVLASLAVVRWRNHLKAVQNLPQETQKNFIPGIGLDQPTSVPEGFNPSVQPGSGMIEPPDAQSALLIEIRGLVQIQEANGTWNAAHDGMILQAGQNLCHNG